MNFKKYPEQTGNLLFWFTNLITLGMVCPATIRNIEAENPLLGAGDFLSESLHFPGGLLYIVCTWLQQWFVYPWIGAAIISTLVTICSLCIWTILKMEQTKESAFAGILFAGILLICEFPDVQSLLQSVISLIILMFYCQLKQKEKAVWISILTLCFYPVIGTEATLSLFLAMFLLDFNCSTKIKSWIYSCMGLILVLCFPHLWSECLFYLNDEQRKWCDFTNFNTWIMILLPAIIWVNHKIQNRNEFKFYNIKVKWGIHLLVALIMPAYYLLHKEVICTQEQFYCMEQSAEKGDWNKVLELANSKRPNYTDLHLRYALLAESELATLADHLFYYPVTSTTDLFFWRKNEEKESFFNSLFYKSIGVADEYMHQIFEMGMTGPNGTSARTIRHLTEAAILQKDKNLAIKYFNIADKSQKDQAWSLKVKKQIGELNKKSSFKDTIPNRSEFFIGSYKPQTEFTYMVINDSNNIKRINLMLCSFLLEKDLGRFKQALIMYQNRFKDRVPQSYAEAYLLLTMADRHFRLPLNIPDEKFQEWISYLRLLNQNQIREINQAYMNTYWYYYLYAKVKKIQ